MDNKKEYYYLEIVGNKKTKTGDQISEWLHPKFEEIKSNLDEWDWSNPFEFEMPGKPLSSEFDEILKDNGLPEKLPDIGKFLLFDSSKLTDFVKGSFLEQYGLIVSGKAKTVLEQFNLGIHKFYPITITLKGSDYSNFFFLKCLTDSRIYVDIENSDFFTLQGYFDKESQKQIKFNTSEELSEFRMNNTKNKLYLLASAIRLRNDFPNFALFKIGDFGINEILVSQELSKKLSTLTGIKLTKAAKIK